MRISLNSLAIALMLALPAALPTGLFSAPAHAQPAIPQAAQANYYKNLVDYDFVKQWVAIPPKKGVMLIDARPAARKFNTGHIKGSINIPMADLAQKIGSLPADRPIVFICSTGARSGEAYDAARLLRAELNVYFLDAKVSYGGDGTFKIML